MPKVIKQFGLMRTGTNYVGSLIALNYKYVHVLTDGIDKHSACPFDAVDDWSHTIITCKHPLSWYLSYTRIAWDFRYSCRVPTEVIKYWCAYYEHSTHLAKVRPDKVTLVRYEDLLVDPEKALTPFAMAAGLQRNDAPWVDFENVIEPCGPDLRKPTVRPQIFDKDFYLKQKFFSVLKEKQLITLLPFLRSHQNLLDRLGYSLTPTTT